MSESQPPPEKKTLKERAKELGRQVIDFLEDLIPAPEPELVPVRVPGRRRRRHY